MRRSKSNSKEHHPAVDAVKNYLSGSEHCLVVWGLFHSKTYLCCQIVADGINQAGGLATWLCCEEMIRSGLSLKQVFLERLGCRTLDEFTRYLPERSCEHTWIIWDAVNAWTPDVTSFFKELIDLSYTCGKFRVLLFTHKTDLACSVLKWSSLQRPIQIVEPIGCCRWSKSLLQRANDPTVNAMDVCGGCPEIQSDAIAGELEALWTIGITRLTRFVRDEWAQSGAFSLPTGHETATVAEGGRQDQPRLHDVPGRPGRLAYLHPPWRACHLPASDRRSRLVSARLQA